MAFASTTIPSQKQTSRAPSVSKEDMKHILELLHKGEAVTDDTVYDKPSKTGKMDPRNVAYYVGYRVREEVLVADSNLTNRDLALKTWPDDEVENGFRWALKLK